jgi:hypothetical protein
VLFERTRNQHRRLLAAQLGCGKLGSLRRRHDWRGTSLAGKCSLAYIPRTPRVIRLPRLLF